MTLCWESESEGTEEGVHVRGQAGMGCQSSSLLSKVSKWPRMGYLSLRRIRKCPFGKLAWNEECQNKTFTGQS